MAVADSVASTILPLGEGTPPFSARMTRRAGTTLGCLSPAGYDCSTLSKQQEIVFYSG
jgi:hypothetical protein